MKTKIFLAIFLVFALTGFVSADKPINPNDPFIRDKMVMDLPELSGFIFSGVWGNPNPSNPIDYIPIDLRYISPIDNDQHSEFALDIYNFSEDAETHFSDLINQAVNPSLIERNGNTIFEVTIEKPIGESRYRFWISGKNLIRSWNGNDLGTIYDNELFDVLTIAYLRKYPSTYGCENGNISGECPASCTNECSVIGKKTCFGNLSKTCGNYDKDSCLEWNLRVTCQNGCSKGICNVVSGNNGEIITTDLNFTKIYSGNYSGKKLKLYFINFGYPNNGYDSFIYDINYSLFADDNFEGWRYKGLFNAEPYKTYKEPFEIYQINRLLNETDIGCNINNPEKPCRLDTILSFARSSIGLNLGQCNANNCNIIVLFIKNRTKLSSYPGAAGMAGGNEYMYMLVEDDFPGEGIKKVFTAFLHEAGHLFGNVLDEYFGGYKQDYDYSDLNTISQRLNGTNCDIRVGCPSWCSGSAKKIERTDDCVNLLTEEECNSYLRRGGGTWGGHACVWITNQEIVNYFGSNCIPEVPRAEVFSWNSGTQCEEGTGCYYGCNGNGWRSTEVSLFAGWITGFPQEWNEYTYDGLEPYNKLQKSMIVRRIESLSSQVVEPNITTGPIEIPQIPGVNCSGCIIDKKCYPFGYRKSGKFCSDENNQFAEQKKAKSSCENNFECSSNVCVSSQCVSEGLLQKILNWFKKIFGID